MKSIHTTLKVFRVLFVLLALAGISLWAYENFGSRPDSIDPGSPSAAESPAELKGPAHLVLVTYFTTDARCPTCLKIEKQAREAVEEAFSGELASGMVRFQTINFDQAANKHFAEDYELAFKTVVISDRHDGKEVRWAKFDEVWDLVEDRPAFAIYLQDGVRKYLNVDSDA